MARHVTHYLWTSGWPDDEWAGCHMEVYEKSSSHWPAVTCKHCLRNRANELAQIDRERAAALKGQP